MTFGYHGDKVTELHTKFQYELQPQSILLYTNPFMKLCAYLAGRAPAWSHINDVISPLSRAKGDNTALKRNVSELIADTAAVQSLRELTVDFAVDVATEIEMSPEAVVLVNLTTLFLSILDGNPKITALIRDNLICDAASCG